MHLVKDKSVTFPMSRVVGLMAGTSLDGIDVVLATTDGSTLQREFDVRTLPYSDHTRDLLIEAVALGAGIVANAALRQTLDQRVADEHAQAVRDVMQGREAIRLIGFHGQTVWHAPQQGLSVQLGDPQRLADQLGITVIGQLRAADIAAGGEGAPLAPVYHAAILQQAGIRTPAAWLNIGGVANLTLIDDGVVAGFDCGPGNALIDRLITQHTGQLWDEGGERALAGQVDGSLVKRALMDEYFLRPAPKSLDRDHFLSCDWWRSITGLALNDAAASLAAITVAGVEHGLGMSPREVETLVVSGGGVHNRAIMDGLRGCGVRHVISSDALGAPADGVEAELVAFLAARHMAGLATSFPSTTGVAEAVVGGQRYLPKSLA